MNKYFKYFFLLSLILTSAGCVKYKTTISTSFVDDKAPIIQHENIVIYTVDINQKNVEGKGSVSSANKARKIIDESIARDLNILGVKSVSQSGSLDKQTLIKIKKENPESTAALINLFRYQRETYNRSNYVLYDLINRKRVATLSTGLNYNRAFLWKSSVNNAARLVVAELKKRNLICCEK